MEQIIKRTLKLIKFLIILLALPMFSLSQAMSQGLIYKSELCEEDSIEYEKIIIHVYDIQKLILDKKFDIILESYIGIWNQKYLIDVLKMISASEILSGELGKKVIRFEDETAELIEMQLILRFNSHSAGTGTFIIASRTNFDCTFHVFLDSISKKLMEIELDGEE